MKTANTKEVRMLNNIAQIDNEIKEKLDDNTLLNHALLPIANKYNVTLNINYEFKVSWTLISPSDKKLRSGKVY